jgi:hypothetical protein
LADEDPENKQFRLMKQLKQKLVGKQNLVPNGGKGKYDLTVPVPPRFLKHKHKKTIRQQRLEQDEFERKMKEEAECRQSFRANDIPKTTTLPLYQKILNKEAKRREKNKEASIAKTKANARPFSFHERDVEKAREAAIRNEDIDTQMLNQFRARIIPWRILVPRFKAMMEKDEHEREQRIRAAAQKSLACSKLPPRMQQHVDEKRRRIEENLDTTRSTAADGDTLFGFTFQPPRARSVPNFRKLQKAFVTQME